MAARQQGAKIPADALQQSIDHFVTTKARPKQDAFEWWDEITQGNFLSRAKVEKPVEIIDRFPQQADDLIQKIRGKLL